MTSSEDQAHWIGDFRIDAELGRGAMGAVYRVMHRSGQGPFALKLLLPETLDDSRALKRFQNEAQSMKTLSEHPGIVTVFQQGFANQGPFVVMEMIEGENLRDLLKRGALSEREALEHVGAVVHALAYAHDHGFVHRDVKPENVMITTDGRALLTDFGVTRVLGALDKLTRTGELLGTPVYMAPEQVSTELGAVCAATDVYAIGVILYQVLLGRSPYEATSTVTLLSKVMNGESFPLPRSLRPRLHPNWQEVIERSLERNPSERYPHAGALAVELDAALAGPVERSRGRALAAGALLLGGAGLGAALLLRGPAEGQLATSSPSPSASSEAEALGASEATLERAWAEGRLAELRVALPRAAEPLRARYERRLEWHATLERAWQPKALPGELLETMAKISGAAAEAGDEAALEPWLAAHARAQVFLREGAPQRALELPGAPGLLPRLAPLALWAPQPPSELFTSWPADALPAARARAAAWLGDAAAAQASLAALDAERAAALRWELAPELGPPASALDLLDSGRRGWAALAQAEELLFRGERLLASEALARAPLDAPGELGAAAQLAQARLRYLWGDLPGARGAWRAGGERAAASLGARLAWARLGASLHLAATEQERGEVARWRPAPLAARPEPRTLSQELASARAGALGVWGLAARHCWEQLNTLEAGGHATELAPLSLWLENLRAGHPDSVLVQLAHHRLELLARLPEEVAPLAEELCQRAPYWGRLLQARHSVARARTHARACWTAHLAGRAPEAKAHSQARAIFGGALGLYGHAAGAAQATPSQQRALRLERAATLLERARLAWVAPGAPAKIEPSPAEVEEIDAALAPELNPAGRRALLERRLALLRTIPRGESPAAAARALIEAASAISPETTQAWWIRAGLGDEVARECALALQIAWGDAPAWSVRSVRRFERTRALDEVVYDPRVPLVRYRQAAGLTPRGADDLGGLLLAAEQAIDLYPLVYGRLRTLDPKALAGLSDARLGAVARAELALELSAQRAALHGLDQLARPGDPIPDLAALSLLQRWREAGEAFPAEALLQEGSLRARRLLRAAPAAGYPARFLATLHMAAGHAERTQALVDRCGGLGFRPGEALDTLLSQALSGSRAAMQQLAEQRPRTALAAFHFLASGGLSQLAPVPPLGALGERLAQERTLAASESNAGLIAAATQAFMRRQRAEGAELALRALDLAHPGGTPRTLRPWRRLRQLQPLVMEHAEDVRLRLPTRLELRAASESLIGGVRPVVQLLANFASGASSFHPHSLELAQLLLLEDPACYASFEPAGPELGLEFDRDLYLRQTGPIEPLQARLIQQLRRHRQRALQHGGELLRPALARLHLIVERAPFPLERELNPELVLLYETLLLDLAAGQEGSAILGALPRAAERPLLGANRPALDRLRWAWHRARLALARGAAPAEETEQALRAAIQELGGERVHAELGKDPWLPQARAALPKTLAGL